MNQQDASIPAVLTARLIGYASDAVTTGQSSAQVCRLSMPGRLTLFLKHELEGEFSEIENEAACLRWLLAAGIPCARVLEELSDKEGRWLLTSEVEGRDITSSAHLTASEIITIAADGLGRLHKLNPADCPFDQRLDHQMQVIRQRLEAGLVEEADFDDERKGRTAHSVFADLVAKRPADEDFVVTHGDATFENLMQRGGRFSGFVDCGRLGVGDRYRDLALVARSIEDRLGASWVGAFFDLYGQKVDNARVEFYQLLDEFF